MADIHPQGWLAYKPPEPKPSPPALDTLHTVVHDGICRHCNQWRVADEVWMDLPSMQRVICLGCYYTITGTRPQIGKQIAADAIAAANSAKE